MLIYIYIVSREVLKWLDVKMSSMTLWSTTRCVLSTFPSSVLSYHPINNILSACMPRTRKSIHGTAKEMANKFQDPPPPSKRIKLARTDTKELELERKVLDDWML